MIAYFADGERAAPAREIARFARIIGCGPWSVSEATLPNGKRGAVAWWSDHPAPNLDRSDWRGCSDGLWYLPPAVLPTPGELARRNCPAGTDVVTAGGYQLTIPLATSAPRKVSFTALVVGDPATEYGVLAARVFDRLQQGPVPLQDPELLRLVGLALSTAYRVTPELLDDLAWVTTADLDPILCAVVGVDPKASAPAGDSSPSPAGG